MIDSVAIAISGAPFPTERSRKKARDAIAAMAEPTDAMAEAAYEAVALSDAWHIEDDTDWKRSYRAALALAQGAAPAGGANPEDNGHG